MNFWDTEQSEPDKGKKKAKKSEPAPVLDLAVALDKRFDAMKAEFLPYKEEIEAMLKEANEFQITDDETAAQAVDKAAEARRLSKKLDKTKLAKTELARNFTGKTNKFVGIFTDPLEKIVKILKQKGNDYAFKKRQEEQKKALEAQREREKLQKKLDEEADKEGLTRVTLPDVAEPVQEKTVTRTESGASSHVTFVWKARIVDPKKVPRWGCEPSQKLLDEAVKAGVREIEGCVVEEVPESRLRT